MAEPIGNPGAMDAAGSYSRIVAGAPRYAFVNVRIDQAKLDAWTARVREIPGALARLLPPALNATAREMRTRLYQAFLARMNIARKTSVRDRLALTPTATRLDWSAGIRIALTRFTVASFKGTRQRQAGVEWQPRPGMVRMIPRAFIRRGLTHYQTGEWMENRQVWKRAVKGDVMVPRYPLQLMRGPSLARVFSDDANFQGAMERQGGQIMEKKVNQQVDRIAADFPR